MHFPLFIDLSDKEILVAGGGRVATRRVCAMQKFAGRITVASPEVTPQLQQMEGEDIVILRRRFQPGDLDGKAMVLAATNDAGLNRRIVLLCRERGIPANDCSDQALCDFQFPSVVLAGGNVVGLNASGADHRLVRRARQKVEQALGTGGQSCYGYEQETPPEEGQDGS